ncbi:MAG: polyprenol monophosphomannose synthase [Nitrososphaerota archaeon]
MSKVVVVMPTYNEAENVEKIVPELLNILRNSGWTASILVVDDSSPDGTADIAEEIGRKIGGVIVLRRGEKLGLGSAYIDGFKYVIGNMPNVDYVCEMDADGSHPPEVLPKMLEIAEKEKYDLVIGSRYVEGGRWSEKSIYRIIVSKTANILGRISTGMKIKDMTSGYRVIRKSILEKIIDKLTELHSGYVFQVQLLYLLYKTGARIHEYPFTFMPRIYGKTKLGYREIFSYFKWCLKTFMERIVS